jgi:hypothetical protein
MKASPQMQEKRLKQRRFIIVTIALVFSAAWAIIGILSVLNIIQTTWSGIASAIFAFLGVVLAVSQWLFPFPPSKESNNSPLDTSTQLRLVEVSVTEEPRIEDDCFPEIKPRSEVMIIQLRPRRLVKDEPLEIPHQESGPAAAPIGQQEGPAAHRDRASRRRSAGSPRLEQ